MVADATSNLATREAGVVRGVPIVIPLSSRDDYSEEQLLTNAKGLMAIDGRGVSKNSGGGKTIGPGT